MATKRLTRVLFVVLGLLILVSILPDAQKKEWREAERFGSLDSYERFLTRFPQSRFAAQARRSMEEIEFAQCRNGSSPEAYRSFLERYPDGLLATRARAAWDSLDWQISRRERSYVAWERYLGAHPQGSWRGAAQAALDTLRNARLAGFRDVRALALDIRQSFTEKVDSVSIGFESEIEPFLSFFGLRTAAPDSGADAVMTVTCRAEALGDTYSPFGIGWGSYYYTGARVSGRLLLETPGSRPLADSYRGELPAPRSVTSPSSDPADAPYEEAMRAGFPPKAVGLLARAFGYPALLGALASERPGLRETAVAVLKNAGVPVQDMLLAALDDEDAAIRAGAAQSLAGHADARVVPALVQCVGREGDDNVALREQAAASLAALGPLSLPALGRARGDARPLVRQGVARALGGIRTPESRTMLVALLEDSVKAVRETAIGGLGRHRNREALDVLIDRLGRDRDHRAACLTALEWSTHQDADESHDPRSVLWDTPRVQRLLATIPLLDSDQAVADLLNAIGEPAVPALAQAMKSGDVRIRTCAARAVGGIFDDRSVAALQAASADTSRDVRLEVARGLASQGSGESIAHLARLFQDPDPQIRSEALGGLHSSLLSTSSRKDYQRHLSSPESIRLLTDAMDIADGSKTGQRDAAAAVLGRIGSPSVDALLACLRHSNRYVREGAMAGLAATGDERAILALLDLTKDPALPSDPELASRLYAALGASRDRRVFDTLIEGLADSTGTRRMACLRALDVFGDPRAVDSLVNMLGGSDTAFDSELQHILERLTDHYPDEEPFDWKAWWLKNRRGYGLK